MLKLSLVRSPLLCAFFAISCTSDPSHAARDGAPLRDGSLDAGPPGDAGEDPIRSLDAGTGQSFEVEAGSCGVSYQLTVITSSWDDSATRTTDGFVVPALSETTDGAFSGDLAFVNDDGTIRTWWDHSGSSFRVGHHLGAVASGSTASSPRAITFFQEVTGMYEGRLFARAVTPAGAAGADHELGEIFVRGTEQSSAAASLDGERAVFTTGHVVVSTPQAFVVDVDARPVGSAVTIEESLGPSPSFACLQATPTQHAAALSLLTDTEFKLVELTKDGKVAQRVAFDVPGVRSGSCPLVQLTPVGFVIIWRTESGATQIYTVSGGIGEPFASLRGNDIQSVLWAMPSGPDSLLVLVSRPTEGLGIAELPRDGTLRWLPAVLPRDASVIPSELNRLFVTYNEEDYASVTNQRIAEIKCAGLEFGM